MAPNMDTRKTVVGGRRIRSIVVRLGMTLVLGARIAALVALLASGITLLRTRSPSVRT
jgi:hypothetical protein